MTSATTSNTATTSTSNNSNSNNNNDDTTNTNTTNPNNNRTTTTSSRPNSSSSSSSSISSSSACAACKYQRRKCNPDCPLAPYFPANQQQKFINAHRLFGVRNIRRIIEDLDTYHRNEAMTTIIYQSDMRAHDPVGGCYHYIRELERQIEHDSAELALVLRQLTMYRAQTQTIAADIDVNILNTATDDDAAGNVIYDVNLFPAAAMNQPHDQQQYYNYFCYDGGGTSGDQNNIDPNASINNNILSIHEQQHQQCVVVDDDDAKPLVDMFEVRQTLVGVDDEGDSRNNTISDVGSLHCSTNLELKDESNQVERVQEHDLKGAASLFTLTNCSSSSPL